MEENMVNEEIVENEVVCEEAKSHKGAIVAGVAAAAVAIGCGAKWLFGKLRDTNPEYVDQDEDDELEGITISDEIEVTIEED